MAPDGERLAPPPIVHICEICKVNPVSSEYVRAGSPVAYMCSSCEEIIMEWERRKKEHRAFLFKIFKERKK